MLLLCLKVNKLAKNVRWEHTFQKVTFVCTFLKARDILQEFGSSYLLYSGSIFCCFLVLLRRVGSENLKNFGANSTIHRASIDVTSLMYSLVVNTNS